MKAKTISTVSENVLIFFISNDKISSGDLLNDFTSLSDDLEKSRARSPDQDSCISEAQFIFSALKLRQM